MLAAAFMFSCDNSQTSTETAQTNQETEIRPSFESFGAEISPDDAMSPEEVIAALEGKDSVRVKIVSNIEETCKKKGCWVTLNMGEGRDLMRVKFKDYGFFVPLDSDGRTAIMEGVAYVQTTTVEQLRHYAEDAGKTEEEIAEITEPETKLTFLADGVLLK